MMGVKGHWQRARVKCTQKQWDKNWEMNFGNKEKDNQEKENCEESGSQEKEDTV